MDPPSSTHNSENTSTKRQDTVPAMIGDSVDQGNISQQEEPADGLQHGGKPSDSSRPEGERGHQAWLPESQTLTLNAPTTSLSSFPDMKLMENTAFLSSAAEMNDYFSDRRGASLLMRNTIDTSDSLSDIVSFRPRPLDMFSPSQEVVDSPNSSPNNSEKIMRDTNENAEINCDQAETDQAFEEAQEGDEFITHVQNSYQSDDWKFLYDALGEASFSSGPALTAYSDHETLLDYPAGFFASFQGEQLEKTTALSTSSQAQHDGGSSDHHATISSYPRVVYADFLDQLEKEQTKKEGKVTKSPFYNGSSDVTSTNANKDETTEQPDETAHVDHALEDASYGMAMTHMAPSELHDILLNLVPEHHTHREFLDQLDARAAFLRRMHDNPPAKTMESAENFQRNELYSDHREVPENADTVVPAADNTNHMAPTSQSIEDSYSHPWDWDENPNKRNKRQLGLSEEEDSEFVTLTGNFLHSIQQSLTQIARLFVSEESIESFQRSMMYGDIEGQTPEAIAEIATDSTAPTISDHKSVDESADTSDADAASLSFLEHARVQRSPYDGSPAKEGTLMTVPLLKTQSIPNYLGAILLQRNTYNSVGEASFLRRHMMQREPFLQVDNIPQRTSDVKSLDDAGEKTFLERSIIHRASFQMPNSSHLYSMVTKPFKSIPENTEQDVPGIFQSTKTPVGREETNKLVNLSSPDGSNRTLMYRHENSESDEWGVDFPEDPDSTLSHETLDETFMSSENGNIVHSVESVGVFQRSQMYLATVGAENDYPVDEYRLDTAEPIERVFMDEQESMLMVEDANVDFPHKSCEIHVSAVTGSDLSADHRTLCSSESAEVMHRNTLYMKTDQLEEICVPRRYDYDSTPESSEIMQRHFMNYRFIACEALMKEDANVDFPYDSLPKYDPEAKIGRLPDADLRSLRLMESAEVLHRELVYEREVGKLQEDSLPPTLESSETDLRIAINLQTLVWSADAGDYGIPYRPAADEKYDGKHYQYEIHSSESAEALHRENSYMHLLELRQISEESTLGPLESAEEQQRMLMYKNSNKHLLQPRLGDVHYPYDAFSPGEHEGLGLSGKNSSADMRLVHTIESVMRFQRSVLPSLTEQNHDDDLHELVCAENDDDAPENLKLEPKGHRNLFRKARELFSRSSLKEIPSHRQLCTMESAESFQRRQMNMFLMDEAYQDLDYDGNYDFLQPPVSASQVHVASIYHSFPSFVNRSESAIGRSYSTQVLPRSAESAEHMEREKIFASQWNLIEQAENDRAMEEATSSVHLDEGTPTATESTELSARQYMNYMHINRDDGDFTDNSGPPSEEAKQQSFSNTAESAESVLRQEMFQMHSAEPEDGAVEYPDNYFQNGNDEDEESVEAVLREQMYNRLLIHVLDSDYYEDHNFETLESTEDARREAIYAAVPQDREPNPPLKRGKFTEWFSRLLSKTPKGAQTVEDSSHLTETSKPSQASIAYRNGGEDVQPLGMNLRLSEANTSMPHLSESGDKPTVSRTFRHQERHDFLSRAFGPSVERMTEEPNDRMMPCVVTHPGFCYADEEPHEDRRSGYSLGTRMWNAGYFYHPDLSSPYTPRATDSDHMSFSLGGNTAFFQNQSPHGGDSSHVGGSYAGGHYSTEPAHWGADAGNDKPSIDMEAIQPYRKMIEYGGTYGGDTSIILLWAYHLPSRSAANYFHIMDHLFRYILKALDVLTAGHFKVLYFNYGQDPPATWLHDCFTLMDSEHGKTLDKLYIIHPAYWFKNQLQVMGRPNLSESFCNKIRYISNLKELTKTMSAGFMEFVNVPSAISDYDIGLRVSDSHFGSDLSDSQYIQ